MVWLGFFASQKCWVKEIIVVQKRLIAINILYIKLVRAGACNQYLVIIIHPITWSITWDHFLYVINIKTQSNVSTFKQCLKIKYLILCDIVEVNFEDWFAVNCFFKISDYLCVMKPLTFLNEKPFQREASLQLFRRV